MTSASALVVADLSVRFGSMIALESVSLAVAPQSIHGIIGPNGSGKTTLLNALCGFVDCSGSASLFGRPLLGLPPHRRAALGLGRTFQNPKVDNDLTVRDVLRIGEHRRVVRQFWKETLAPWLADADARTTDRRAFGLCRELGVELASLEVPMASIAYGVVKMLDLARAMMSEPRLILLDEVTSGLSRADIAVVQEQLRRLRANGVTVVTVEHNIRFLVDVCDRVTVLNAGRCIADGAVTEVLRMPEVVKAYMGEETAPPSAVGQERRAGA
ncbi:MAG: ABC transporter ATP-binding protein [Acetobacteraceae bacterium]